MTHARVGDQLHTLEAVQALPAGAVIVWHERDTSDTRAGVICRSLDRDGRIYSELEHTAPPHWIRGLDNGEVLHTQILQLPATLVHLPRQTLSRTIDPAALAPVIYKHYPATQLWDGEPYAFHEDGAATARDRAHRAAIDILAVLTETT